MKKIVEHERHIQLLKAIAKTGFFTDVFLKFYIGINRHTIRKYCKSGSLIRLEPSMIYGVLSNIYILSENEKKRLKQEFNINPYKADLTQLEHDYCLAQIYYRLKYAEKESWITESSLKLMYPDAPSVTDGMYLTSNGQRVGVEVITFKYSEEEIKKKSEFISKYCDEHIVLHTHKSIDFLIT